MQSHYRPLTIVLKEKELMVKLCFTGFLKGQTTSTFFGLFFHNIRIVTLTNLFTFEVKFKNHVDIKCLKKKQ